MRIYFVQAHTYNKQTQQVHKSNNHHNNNMKKAGQSHSSIKTIFFSYKSIIQNNLRECVCQLPFFIHEHKQIIYKYKKWRYLNICDALCTLSIIHIIYNNLFSFQFWYVEYSCAQTIFGLPMFLWCTRMILSLRMKLMGKLKRHGRKEKQNFFFTGQHRIKHCSLYNMLSPKAICWMH